MSLCQGIESSTTIFKVGFVDDEAYTLVNRPCTKVLLLWTSNNIVFGAELGFAEMTGVLGFLPLGEIARIKLSESIKSHWNEMKTMVHLKSQQRWEKTCQVTFSYLPKPWWRDNLPSSYIGGRCRYSCNCRCASELIQTPLVHRIRTIVEIKWCLFSSIVKSCEVCRGSW